jgi:hypothetical protein
MPTLTYHNTKFTVPGWTPFNDKEPRGIAYETDTHFVHIYGKDAGLRVISVGLTVTEAKNGALKDWIADAFGATNVMQSRQEAGHSVEGVWRPGLFFGDEMLQALGATAVELRLAEQVLLLLVQRLDELLLFVEPSAGTLAAYGHKARELLILACTEVETSWKHYMKRALVAEPAGGYSTNQYVQLKQPLHLEEYQVSLTRYGAVPATRPFQSWAAKNPTKSLGWYDAYNKTKHDRATHFASATLANCIEAVAANIVLFAVRFGPFPLLHGAGTLAALFNQTFSLELVAPAYESFYAPLIKLPPNQRRDRICFGSRELVQPWTVAPFKV